MNKEDVRFQALEHLHERRKQVVRLHRKGIGVMRIVELSGLSNPAARGVIVRYEWEGAKSIKPTPAQKAQRFTGATKRRWSTPTSEAAAMPRRARCL
jgi:hypothetical protein